MLSFIKSNFPSLGLSLAVCGVPLAMYFNFLIPIFDWSIVLMFFSVFLLMNFGNIFTFRFPLYSNFIFFVIFFQVLMILYGLYFDEFEIRYLFFHLYVIFFSFAIISNQSLVSLDKFILYVFFISGLCAIIGNYLIYSGVVIGEDAYLLRKEEGLYSILDYLTMSYSSFLNFVSILFLWKPKKKFRLFLLIFVFLDFNLMLNLGKRTALFLSVVVFSIFIFFRYKEIHKSFFKFLFFLLVIFFFVFGFSDFGSKILVQFDNLYSGISVLLGFQDSDYSGSVSERVLYREYAFEFIDTKFSIFNYLFGYGYMTKWLDNPLLQSFLDMGLLGFFCYLFQILVYPLVMGFRWVKKSNFIFFAFCLSLYNVFSIFHSGNPYIYLKYIPVIIISFFISIYNKQRNNFI